MCALQVCFKRNIDPFPSCLFQQKQEVEGCFLGGGGFKECFNVSTCSTLFFYSWHTCQAGRRPSVLYFITLWVNLILNVTVPLQCCLILAIKHKHILPLDQSGFPYTTFIFMSVLAVCILSLLSSSVRCLLLVCFQQNIKFH